MKFLVVLTATLACSLAKPGLLGGTITSYSALGSIATPLGAPIATPLAAAPIATPLAAAPISTTVTEITSPIATRLAAAPIATPLAAAPISTTVTEITSPIATRVAVAPIAAAPISTTVTELTSPIARIAAPLSAPIAAPLSAPIATPLVTPIATALSGHNKYHAQDVIGQASYGHNEALQAHHAVQDAAGNKIGSFSYVSPEGSVLRTDYVADGLGYRVASNALPVGPSAPVADTAEVIAARDAHIAAHEAAKSRVRRQILATPLALGHTSLISPLHTRIVAPVAIGHTPAATAPLAHTLIL